MVVLEFCVIEETTVPPLLLKVMVNCLLFPHPKVAINKNKTIKINDNFLILDHPSYLN